MSETFTCRYCHKTIARRSDGWKPVAGIPSNIDRYCGYAPASVLYHAPSTGTDDEPRPEGPYLLHLGIHFFDDDAKPLTGTDLAPFLTEGDSWNQWGEPFDGTQRVTVPLDTLPDGTQEYALGTARALRALLDLRDLTGCRVGDYASFTMDDTRDRSEWEIVAGTCDA